MKQAACALAVAFAALTIRAEAVTIVPMTFEQLVREAAAIVYGRVTEVRGQWTDDRQAIDSLIAVEALQYLKGDLGRRVALRLPGGEAGGRINVIPGAPSLREGDLVVLFLKAHGPARLTTLGLTQGIFRVTPEPRSGAMVVTPPPLKESDLGRVIRGSSSRRGLPLTAFAAAVQGVAAQ